MIAETEIQKPLLDQLSSTPQLPNGAYDICAAWRDVAVEIEFPVDIHIGKLADVDEKVTNREFIRFFASANTERGGASLAFTQRFIRETGDNSTVLFLVSFGNVWLHIRWSPSSIRMCYNDSFEASLAL